MRLKRWAGICAAAMLVLAATAGTASARTLVVSPGESIQAHVDRARGGDTVVVAPGTFRQSVDVNKGITLRGLGTVLRPGPAGSSLCNRFAPGTRTAICVHGKLRFGEQGPSLVRPVKNVSVRGFNIRGFSGDGIFGFGTRQLRVVNNRFIDNGGYGVFSLLSRGTHIRHNIAARNGDFSFYVGDSRRAHAVIRNNRATDSHGGILVRNASIGRVTHNVVAGNCAGIWILADAPGPASHWRVTGNRAIANNRGCPASPQEGPALSGLGILVSGARDVLVRNNVARGHRRLHPTVGTAGIAVVRGDRNPPRGVRVVGNLALKNSNDIFWDRSGRVRFVANQCRRSSPGRICN